jgi:hypothetical protein
VVAVLSFYSCDAAGFTDADCRIAEAAAEIVAEAHAAAAASAVPAARAA